jgi:type II secretory pathway pseudopilin PulG
MTELMVVVAIIAVLAGILLTAMGGVRRRALSTQTESTMQEFSKACEAFQIEHNRYPGVIPEQVLAEIYANTSALPISGTENALLHLMGGYRVLTPFDPTTGPVVDDYDAFGGANPFERTFATASGQWRLKVDVNQIGEGARIDGKLYAPYFTPSEATLQAALGQVGDPDPTDPAPRLPDLVDAWGQPIVYVRRARTNGALVGVSGDTAQFFTASMTPYTESDRLGKMAANQVDLSILNQAPEPEATFAQILRHPGFGTFDQGIDSAINGTARGAFVLFSAGPDGVYFSIKDGPGTPGQPEADIVDNADTAYNTPRVVDEYDDLRVFGGG